MNSCEQIQDSLGAWLDGELSPRDAEAVRLHVGACKACGEERKNLEKLNAALKAVLVPAAADVAFEPFWRAVRNRIEERRPWTAEWAQRAGSWFTMPSLVWAVPAIIVLLLGVFSFDSFFPGWRGAVPRNNFAAVESIDAYGRNVALLREDETKTTVIWLFQNPEDENDSAADNVQKGPTF